MDTNLDRIWGVFGRNHGILGPAVINEDTGQVLHAKSIALNVIKTRVLALASDVMLTTTNTATTAIYSQHCQCQVWTLSAALTLVQLVGVTIRVEQ